MDVISLVEKKYLKSDVPDFRSGDTVRVHVKVKEVRGNVSRCSKALSSPGSTGGSARPSP